MEALRAIHGGLAAEVETWYKSAVHFSILFDNKPGAETVLNETLQGQVSARRIAELVDPVLDWARNLEPLQKRLKRDIVRNLQTPRLVERFPVVTNLSDEFDRLTGFDVQLCSKVAKSQIRWISSGASSASKQEFENQLRRYWGNLLLVFIQEADLPLFAITESVANPADVRFRALGARRGKTEFEFGNVSAFG